MKRSDSIDVVGRVGVRSALGALLLVGFAAAGFGLVSLSTAGQSARRSTDPPIRPTGKLGQDLFLAIDHRDVSGVESLLKEGADPNSRNGLEFTPLDIAAASHQLDVMQALLKAGAHRDAASTYGTALTFAAGSGHVEGAKLLLSLGVKVDPLRTDGMSPLMLASNIGATPIVDDLIKRKADVNAQDDGGATALIMAARNGNLGVAKLLIVSGAAVNTADVEGRTALMGAAMNGHDDLVRLLLNKGAKPDLKDASGRTALVLTASYGDYPNVARALIEGKARKDVKDAQGRTASRLALLRGFTDTETLLAGGSSAHTPTLRQPREAVSRSLTLVQTSMLRFSEATSCVSCHQEGLGRIATGEARADGFRLDPQVQGAQMGRIHGMLTALRPLHEQALKSPEAAKQLPLVEINEVSTIDSWLLAGMAAQNEPPTEATSAMAMCLARQQSPDGCWTFSVPRVPMQSSFFTFTALAVKALESYGPKSHGSEIAERIGNARAWMLKTEPRTSEDRASRLLGLKWSGGDSEAIRGAVAQILADQRADGGWSQLPDRHSDAYATGQALYALRVGGGLPVRAAAYERGTNFLLRTQDDDGSWYVAKRAMPANNYFDAGFPHGESQYASFNGTCWAILALLPTITHK